MTAKVTGVGWQHRVASAGCIPGHSREHRQDPPLRLSDAALRQPADRQQAVAARASEMQLGMELMPLAEFVPLPTGVDDQHRLVGR